ncbi:efflux RND transporter periplasmic adaptor subunit [Pinisolibacter sp.]|uniref:efflux RND transporter periplasmic adaptor subunit n=1 Tax=Pinisolibacter sp. TaxID=2172024 RepID=UPI002FDECF3C
MTRPNFRSTLALAGALAAAATLAGCREEKAEETVDHVRPVKTMTITAGDETRLIRYSGSVRARVETALGFRVPGKLVERRVDVGTRVETGRILARLDPTDLELALKAAEANVAAARSREKVAEDGLARARSLNTKGFVADANLDRAKLEADQAAASLDAALSARDQAANQMAYADLLADAPGIVTDIRADVGQVVAAGTPVAVLARDGEKEVAIAVPEQDVVHFTKDQTVDVRFWADADLRLPGRVREIAGAADPASRTYAVRVTLPTEAPVRLGMTATVEAKVPVAVGSVVVPLSALGEDAGKPRVWIVDTATASVAPRAVTLGRVAPQGVRILDGLKPGDRIVTAGVQFLTPGKKVALPADTAAAAPTH